MSRFRRMALAAIALTLVAACAGDDDEVGNASGDLEEFCAVMTSPPPTEAFRNPDDAAARAELDAHAAIAERVAPDDIRDEATSYRRSVHTYLEGLASGERSSDAFREAQAEQLRSGRAINDYIDAKCDDFSADEAVEHRPTGELSVDPVLQQPGAEVLVGPGDSDTRCIQIGVEPATGPSCHAKPELKPGADAAIVLATADDVVVGLIAPEIQTLEFEVEDAAVAKAKISAGVFSVTVDTGNVTAVHASASGGDDVSCEIWDSPLFQFTCAG